MFSCLDTEQEARAKNIMKDVERYNKKLKEENKKKGVQILMLGTGASGKTTFIKQMKILRAEGFNQKEKESYTKKIHEDVNRACASLYSLLSDGSITGVSDDTKKCLYDIYEALGESTQQPTSEELMKACQACCSDEKIKDSLMSRVFHRIPDNATYFLQDDNYKRILDPAYLPSEQDILFSRTPTTGVAEHIFDVAGKGRLRVCDVGGQKCERMKWITLFDFAEFVMFVIDGSAYDKPSEDNLEINCLMEAMMLLGGISSFQCLSNAGFLVFFNKTDLLEQKTARVEFGQHFPNYSGDNTYDSVKEFLQKIAREVASTRSSALYIYFTEATNSKNFEHVLQAVLDKIYMENVAQYTN